MKYLCLCLCLCLCFEANAAPNKVYLLGGLDSGPNSFSKSLSIGYTFSPYMELQAGFNILSLSDKATSNNNVKGVSLSSIFNHPIYEDFDLYGSLGVFGYNPNHYLNTNVSVVFRPTLGFGVKYKFNDKYSLMVGAKWLSNLEVASNKKDFNVEAKTIFVGVKYNFFDVNKYIKEKDEESRINESMILVLNAYKKIISGHHISKNEIISATNSINNDIKIRNQLKYYGLSKDYKNSRLEEYITQTSKFEYKTTFAQIKKLKTYLSNSLNKDEQLKYLRNVSTERNPEKLTSILKHSVKKKKNKLKIIIRSLDHDIKLDNALLTILNNHLKVNSNCNLICVLKSQKEI